MDLSFQTSQMKFLKQLMQDVKYQEETAEAIVPDSYPDILAIIDASAEPYIRGKECREGSVLLSGGIKGCILYEPEDHSCPRALDFYLPFTMKFDQSALTEHTQVLCSVRVRSAEGYTVNSRKAMLRVNLGCQISAFEDNVVSISSLKEIPECLQIRQASYDLLLPLETAEKSFVLQDTLELSSDLPSIMQICKIHHNLIIREKKLVGDKAVWKGSDELKLLYLGNDAQYHLFQKSIPFSQFCELSCAYDLETLELYPALTGCNWDAVHTEDMRQLEISVHILVQCLISGIRKWELIEDAYCIHDTLQPQWANYALRTQLDQQIYHQPIHQAFEQTFQQFLDADLYVGFPSCSRQNDLLQLTVPIQVHLLGYTGEGLLTGISTASEENMELPGAAQCLLVSQIVLNGAPSYNAMSSGSEFSCDLTLTAAFYADQTLVGLEGGTLEPCADSREDLPSFILSRVLSGTSIWELAKQYGTSSAAIQAANELDAEILDRSQFILIPIV